MSKLNYLKKNGFRRSLKKAIDRVNGMEKMQDEIDTLYYFLNNYTDITSLRTADDELKKLQDGCEELLLIFHNLCQRHGLRYWLDGGTLLGAVRHHGFIPWDDDMDVAMPRDDYNKVVPLMQEEMSKYGIRVGAGGHFDDMPALSRLAFEYKALETGGWIDIFPYDSMRCDENFKRVKNEITSADNRYTKYYLRKYHRLSEAQMLEKKAKFYSKVDRGQHEIYFHGAEFSFIRREEMVFKTEDLFPLKLMCFGKYNFYVPNNYDMYLSNIYGDYMKFPRNGVEHHTDPDGNTAASRIRKNDTDMDKVVLYLHKIAGTVK